MRWETTYPKAASGSWASCSIKVLSTCSQAAGAVAIDCSLFTKDSCCTTAASSNNDSSKIFDSKCVNPSMVTLSDLLYRHNGIYLQGGSTVQTGTYSREDILMNELLGYLQKQERTDQPFFVYYDPNAIHFTVKKQGDLKQNGPALFMPSGYKERYLKEERYKGISDYTLSVSANCWSSQGWCSIGAARQLCNSR